MARFGSTCGDRGGPFQAQMNRHLSHPIPISAMNSVLEGDDPRSGLTALPTLTRTQSDACDCADPATQLRTAEVDLFGQPPCIPIALGGILKPHQATALVQAPSLVTGLWKKPLDVGLQGLHTPSWILHVCPMSGIWNPSVR